MYQVWFYEPVATGELQEWLEEMLAIGYELVTVTGNYFIFKAIEES